MRKFSTLSIIIILLFLVHRRTLAQPPELKVHKRLIVRCISPRPNEIEGKLGLEWINYFRNLNHLDSCTISDSLNYLANEAAFISMTNKRLTHEIDRNAKCYSDLRKFCCSRSLLGNTVGSLKKLTPCLVFFQDNGSNNKCLGHRRWLLYPDLSEIGYSFINGYEAIFPVVKESNDKTKQLEYSFPSEGSFNRLLIPNRWSWSIYTSAEVVAQAAQVIININGKEYFPKIICTDTFLKEFTVVWEMDRIISRSMKLNKSMYPSLIKVRIIGLTLDGSPLDIDYEVSPIN